MILTIFSLNYLLLWINFCIFACEVYIIILIMYSKKRNRFTRDALVCSSSCEKEEPSITKAEYFRYISPSNDNRLQRTLDLVGVEPETKPSINVAMIPICERIEEEERLANIEMARRWRERCVGWPANMMYDCMGEDDYLLGDDGHVLSAKEIRKLNKKIYGGKQDKKSKKRGHRGSKKSRYDEDDYVVYGGYDEYDDYEVPYKSIKFYPDVTNELSVIEFSTLKEFSDYCDKNGYAVGGTDMENLKNWNVVHCCLDPIDLEYGEYAIVTDTSYGGLFWTVADDLPDDVKEDAMSGNNVEARTFTD